MIKADGDWKDLRALLSEGDDEIDLHFGRRDREQSYDDIMGAVEELVRESLATAQENGGSYVMFVHGWSTSRPGQTTARSVVRSFMRSTQATPFIVRSQSVQHKTVFVAKIKSRAP